jgi:hypothetical protein
MEKVDCIHNLLNRGRSKGASVLISLQSIEGLIDVYKEHRAQDILGACTTKTFLRVGDPKSADWAERYFGTVRRMERVVTESSGGNGGPSRSVQYKVQDHPALLASTFLNLAITGPGKRYEAINDVPWLDTTLITHRWFDEINAWRTPKATDVEAVKPRNPDDQKLEDWTPNEEKLFGLEPRAAPKRRQKPSRRLPDPRPPESPDLPGLSPVTPEPAATVSLPKPKPTDPHSR